ncbi:hypothetical protein DE146DRAFT_66731 [Phaeosphaeria sp. MPI-PUGE-AT-0046c]|nr:hypothetical protein DE146DRAFT_66731 [Phaeosphaeria sp. MPI-PUGE-AT-0046c]
MADDTNFSGGRLRLTAFLRAVENGMPQRPSRFRRRMQLSREGTAELNDSNFFYTPCTGRTDSRHMDNAVQGMETDAQKEGPSHARVGHRVPSSPNLEEITSIDLDGYGSKNPWRAPVNAKSIRQTSETATAHRTATKGPIRQTRSLTRPQKSQKRQLPGDCLPLIRTSTSDGLPDPFDARATFAVPITEIDPIHDTQQTTALLAGEDVAVAQSGKEFAELKVLKDNHRPQQSSSSLVKARKGPYPRPQETSTGTNPGSSPSITFHEGFVGDELTIKPPRRAHHREKQIPRFLKPIPTRPGLQLATGVLPTPLLENDDHHVSAEPRNRSSSTLHTG